MFFDVLYIFNYNSGLTYECLVLRQWTVNLFGLPSWNVLSASHDFIPRDSPLFNIPFAVVGETRINSWSNKQSSKWAINKHYKNFFLLYKVIIYIWVGSHFWPNIPESLPGWDLLDSLEFPNLPWVKHFVELWCDMKQKGLEYQLRNLLRQVRRCWCWYYTMCWIHRHWGKIGVPPEQYIFGAF